MATATIKGVTHLVRMVQDLGDNWALEIYPEPPPGAQKRQELYKPWPVPLCLKLHADSRGHALVAGLEHLKQLGRIDAYEVADHERPPPPPAPKPAPAPTAT